MNDPFDMKQSIEMALATQSGARCTVHPNTLRKWLKEYERACTEVRTLRAKVQSAISVGHNDDCLFCGLKDKNLMTDKQRAAAADKGQSDV